MGIEVIPIVELSPESTYLALLIHTISMRIDQIFFIFHSIEIAFQKLLQYNNRIFLRKMALKVAGTKNRKF